ncbi:MAG TPA: hypothetical protein VMD31_14970 [Opitutaceae bacterium]|nr:hypothetical protein [Opitutaceae bacterium]
MNWHRKVLVGLLAASEAVRLWIAGRGGQSFWPDEGRYATAQRAADALMHGQGREFLHLLFGHADHVLFPVIGLVPALAERLGAGPWLPAAFFGLFSTGTICLVWRISRESGGDEEEALLAAGVAAGSVSLLYFSRHYFPYDVSLCFALLGLRAACRSEGVRPALAAGLWTALAFLTYNGYWLLGGAIVVIAVVRPPLTAGRGWRRAGLALLGLALPVVIVAGLARAAGADFFGALVRFSRTATQGDFGGGWAFVGSYFWAGERWLAGVWLLAVVAACALAMAGRRRHLLWWVAAAAGIYAGMVGLCDGLHQFVIYGRIARGLVPLLALVTGGCLAALGQSSRLGRRVQWVLLAGMAGQMVWNFAPALTQRFPADFQREARRRIDAAPAAERGRFRILNAYFFFYAQSAMPPAGGTVVLQARHPLRFRPYLYEGYTREQRAWFDDHDVTMLLMRVDGGTPVLARPPDPMLEGYVGPVSLDVMLPGTPGLAGEPLVTTGETGRGDFLYLICAPATGTIRIGLDHWRYGGPISSEIAVDYSRPHRFDLSLGSLMPPDSSGLYRLRPEWRPLDRWLFVRLDGKIVFSQAVESYPAAPFELAIAANSIGGTTANPAFGGVLLRAEPLDPAGVAALIAAAAGQSPP